MNWKAIVQNLEQERESLQADSKKVYLVNAGRMNHGKSSLLNSILGRDEFAVKDVRETRVNKEVKVTSNVYLVDTPGLDANADDDTEAYEVYKKANFIFFVHTSKISEFRAKELEHLREMEKLLSKDYLWSHIAFVITFIDELEEEEINIITKDMRKKLEENFQVTEVKMFRASNDCYNTAMQAMKEKSKKRYEALLKMSGIPEIRDFIEEHIPIWQSEGAQALEPRFQNVRAKAEEILRKEYLSQKELVDNKEREVAYSSIIMDCFSNEALQIAIDELKKLWRGLHYAKEAYESSKRELEELESKN